MSQERIDNPGPLRPTVDVRLIGHGTPDYDAAVHPRRTVLRTPLGLDFTPEELAHETSDRHFAAFHDERLIGTVIMSAYEPDTVKLRQMAVAQDMRGRNIGETLLAAFENHARRLGITKIVLAARQTAQGFYERHGYAVAGEVFTQVTLPHIRMWKTL